MEMHADIAETPAKRRSSKARLFGHIDGRTRAGKRARAIAAELEASFGDGITKGQRRSVESAAVLSVIAEDLAMRRLAGQPVSLDELLRAQGVAARAIRALGLRVEPAPKPSGGLTIARARWEEQRAQEQAKKAREATTAKDTEVPSDGRAA
jgi:hypothetical protein